MEKSYHVYIMASRRNGTLYVGVTSDIVARVWQHRSGAVKGFTQQYGVHRLVHCEAFTNVAEAIAREKALKKWRRAWKLDLIERDNPQWLDLSEQFNG